MFFGIRQLPYTLGVCVRLLLSKFGGTASVSYDRWALARLVLFSLVFFCWGGAAALDVSFAGAVAGLSLDYGVVQRVM